MHLTQPHTDSMELDLTYPHSKPKLTKSTKSVVVFKTTTSTSTDSLSTNASTSLTSSSINSSSNNFELYSNYNSALFEFVYISNKEQTQHVDEYLNDIYCNLLREEQTSFPKINPMFIEFQPEINQQMRAILIDWIIEVHLRFNLKTKTLFLAVHILDTYLSLASIQRSKFQLLGITALLIASKQEEIYTQFKLKDLCETTDNAYTVDQLKKMESIVLNVIQFNLLSPTALDFYEILAKYFQFNKRQFHFGQFFMESFIIGCNYAQVNSSVIACASAYIVMKFFKLKNYQICYDQRLYSVNENRNVIKDTAKEMCCFVENLDSKELQSVRNKFSLEQFDGVAFLCYRNKRNGY